MFKYEFKFTILVILAISCKQIAEANADTWRLEQGQDWKQVSAEGQDKFLLAVSEIKKLVNSGQTKAAQKAFNKLKKDFPEIAGPDLDAFIKAELLFSEGKFAKAVWAYDKLLNDYPTSKLAEAAMDRQFDIATAFLGGQRRTVLGIFKMKGYAEGIAVMEKITTRAGIDSPIGLKATLAVAKNYEQRQRFNEAYLKWREIASQWETGQTAKEALLSMSRCNYAFFNRYPEDRRAMYDASSLITAKGYYERFKLAYPQDANQMDIDETLGQIDEQLAYKQFTIGQYYQRTGSTQPANLYYDMVISNWPDTKAAAMAKQAKQELLKKTLKSKQPKTRGDSS